MVAVDMLSFVSGTTSAMYCCDANTIPRPTSPRVLLQQFDNQVASTLIGEHLDRYELPRCPSPVSPLLCVHCYSLQTIDGLLSRWKQATCGPRCPSRRRHTGATSSFRLSAGCPSRTAWNLSTIHPHRFTLTERLSNNRHMHSRVNSSTTSRTAMMRGSFVFPVMMRTSP